MKMRLLNWMTSARPSRMPPVTIVSNRIADSPCVLVTGRYGWSSNMVSALHAVLFTVTYLFDRSVSLVHGFQEDPRVEPNESDRQGA